MHGNGSFKKTKSTNKNGYIVDMFKFKNIKASILTTSDPTFSE